MIDVVSRFMVCMLTDCSRYGPRRVILLKADDVELIELVHERQARATQPCHEEVRHGTGRAVRRRPQRRRRRAAGDAADAIGCPR